MRVPTVLVLTAEPLSFRQIEKGPLRGPFFCLSLGEERAAGSDEEDELSIRCGSRIVSTSTQSWGAHAVAGSGEPEPAARKNRTH